jgi:hypothetical protein
MARHPNWTPRAPGDRFFSRKMLKLHSNPSLRKTPEPRGQCDQYRVHMQVEHCVPMHSFASETFKAPRECLVCRYGDLPEDLKNGAMDRGLGYTKDLVELQTGYTVDKVLRQHAGKNLSIVDAGAGGGYMSVSPLLHEINVGHFPHVLGRVAPVNVQRSSHLSRPRHCHLQWQLCPR